MSEYTPEQQGRLLGSAVEGVAWALIEYETDTSDRGVSEEHYRDALKRARELLPTLVHPASVVSEEPDVTALRAARAETWDEAIATVFAWWITPEGERPASIVNPYGVGMPVEQEGETDA